MNLNLLENKMVKYRDLIKVEVKENEEPFVVVDQKIISSGYFNLMSDMKKGLKNKIIVRKTVSEKLINAQNELIKINLSLSLYLSYGYRSIEVQKKLFLKQLRQISRFDFFSNPQKLYEEIHRHIAVPTVAGHPTGGAVDLLIFDNKKREFLEFGSSMYDVSTKKSYSFFPNISSIAKKNRMLLRNLMMKYDFAPFNGEWWHFSYGDREWACYYKKKFSIYDQLEFEDIKLK